MRPIRLLLVEDHRVVADVLRANFELDEGFIVAGAVTTAAAAAGAIVSLGPDVVIVDVGLPDGDGIALTAWTRKHHPETAVVVLSSDDDGRLALRALEAGASGFITKTAPFQRLRDAVHGACRGETWIAPWMLSRVLHHTEESNVARNEHAERLATLTPRERDVLSALVAGHDRRRIAAELAISLNTVRTHTKSILAKLGVHSSLEAMSVSLLAGMPVEDPHERRAQPRGATFGRPPRWQ